MRGRALRRACLAALATAAASGQPAALAAVPRIVAATPRAAADDVDGGGLVRVTFSPDGDGRADAVRVTVIADPGDRLELRAHRASRSCTTRTPAVAAGSDGRATLVWDGTAPCEPAGDGSFVLRACLVDDGPCAPRRVLAHRRALSVAVLATGSLGAGQRVAVEIATDRSATTVVDLVPAHHLDAEGRGTLGAEGSTTLLLTVPDVPAGGLWAVRARNGDEVRYAPLVVRDPARPLDDPAPGTALVVHNLLTWRAYDQADRDRDGEADTWYSHPERPSVPVVGAYELALDEPDLRGSEPAAQNVRPFGAWLERHGLRAQAITDVDLARLPLATLERYAAIVFPGHTEYYERAMYAKTLAYRDAGGRLLFFQGNPFYGEVRIADGRVERLSYRYRTPARSDYALAANGFRVCCWPRGIRVTYRVAEGVPERLPWLLAGTGGGAGTSLGRALGEVDAVDLGGLSPAGTVLVASGTVPRHREEDEGAQPAAYIGTRRIPYGPAGVRDQRVDVAYVELPGGGEVFSFGNNGFWRAWADPALLTAAERRTVDRVALNVWRRLTRT